MNYQPEIDPSKVVDYPLERARMYYLQVGLYALKNARSRMQEEIPVAKVAVPEVVDEANVVIQMPAQLTASETLAEIREQIRREAA